MHQQINYWARLQTVDKLVSCYNYSYRSNKYRNKARLDFNEIMKVSAQYSFSFLIQISCFVMHVFLGILCYYRPVFGLTTIQIKHFANLQQIVFNLRKNNTNTNELENCIPQLAAVVLESRVHKSFMLIFSFAVCFGC